MCNCVLHNLSIHEAFTKHQYQAPGLMKENTWSLHSRSLKSTEQSVTTVQKGAPGWLSWLSIQLDFSLGHDLRIMRSSPTLGSVLGVESA